MKKKKKINSKSSKLDLRRCISGVSKAEIPGKGQLFVILCVSACRQEARSAAESVEVKETMLREEGIVRETDKETTKREEEGAFLFITDTKEPCQEHRWQRRVGAWSWHMNCNTHSNTTYIDTLKLT